MFNNYNDYNNNNNTYLMMHDRITSVCYVETEIAHATI